MTYEEAYVAIIAAIKDNENLTIINNNLDRAHFGNFSISYDAAGQVNTIICDRGEIVSCSDLLGDDCSTVLQDVGQVSQDDLLNALQLR
jgi:hypothetical protein